jgi:hypothetical protein
MDSGHLSASTGDVSLSKSFNLSQFRLLVNKMGMIVTNISHQAYTSRVIIELFLTFTPCMRVSLRLPFREQIILCKKESTPASVDFGKSFMHLRTNFCISKVS